MAEILLVEKRDGVATVTLNRPEVRNAFDDSLISGLTRILEEMEKDPATKVLVLAGAGSAFCAGADLNWMKRMAGFGYEQNLADARALATMLKTLDRLSKPTVARVQGPAFAGGTGLVAACDIAIGSTAAEFALTEVKLGLSPATISPYVVRAIGERAARRYFHTGERFGAEEGFRLGLLSMLTSVEKLDEVVADTVRHLTQGGPEAHRRIKDLIAAVSRGGPVADALIDDTAQRIAEIRVSAEGREGIASFLGKRKPAWVKSGLLPKKG